MLKPQGVPLRQWVAIADSTSSKWNQGAIAIRSARHFSSSSIRPSENDGDSKAKQNRLSSLHEIAKKQIDKAFSQSSSTPLIRRVSDDSQPLTPPHQRQRQQLQSQQRRPLDARALGSRLNKAGGKPTNILRAPATLRRPGNNLGGIRAPKRPATARPARRKKLDKSSRSDDGSGWSGQREMSKEEQEADEKAFLEQWERDRPKPVRYNPQGYNIDNLQRTWPALPMGVTGPKEALHERLAWMSERYPNGFEPTDLLAQRIHQGKWTYFYSEEEKNEAVELARKIAAQRADKLTDRKGSLVQPEDMLFEPVNETQKQQLVSRLVSGEYKSEQARWLEEHETRHPVMKDVLRNLANNSTWQSPHKTQFLEVLSKSLPKPKAVQAKV
ncbi:conserved hypothetical protein [Histoplasma capsulatum var. duboisii H88]|uniref:Uncharacterized protein n=1 Tax=Ajellomyces capsulatus (strain H88) TaxID=544711 RepID=F0UMQ0_AJEC8|nr:conserved hypothetical protein [Histoplasma capsulatum var. duboisii H88]QSS53540.1 hypothetical protein I7I53_00831 [Histoplasma capsulatum var. duboisii H88]